MKRLDNNNNSVDGVLRGIKKASDIITSTMGGSGKNVLMFEDKVLQFTKDGVSVAKKIQFKDSEEDAGAQMLITAANKTVKECGDGTTLTSLFTQEFVSRLFPLCGDEDINQILTEWETDVNEVVTLLKERSQKIEKVEQIFNIALTSCKNDALARLIHEIYRKVGLKASISVQLSSESPKTYYEVTKGLNFEGGMIHSGLSNQLNGTFQAEKPNIWITDEVMNDFSEYASIFNEYIDNKESVVIIAKDFSTSFIKYAYSNKLNQGLDICLLKLPGWGAGVNENIKDMKAFITGSKCNKITVTPYDFTIYNNPAPGKVRNRIKQLTAQIDSFTEEFDVIDYTRRIDNLNQTAAIIYVGGRTLTNAQEEFDRIEDAVGACRTACRSGYVKGAGSELVSIADYSGLEWNDEFRNVLYAPARKILKNANISLEPSASAYNVKTKQLDSNLLDPTDVVITALQNSFALATLLINTSYILHD